MGRCGWEWMWVAFPVIAVNVLDLVLTYPTQACACGPNAPHMLHARIIVHGCDNAISIRCEYYDLYSN